MNYESCGLIGIQLHEKYKENFDVSSKDYSTKRRSSPCISFRNEIVSLSIPSFPITDTIPTLEQTAHARLNELHLQKFSLLSKLYFTNQRSIPF